VFPASLKYGLSAVSIVGFSSYGIIVCRVGDFHGGNRYGKLSMTLLKRYAAVRGGWIPHYGIIAQWTQPSRSCFQFLEEAHQVGLEIDILVLRRSSQELLTSHGPRMEERVVLHRRYRGDGQPCARGTPRPVLLSFSYFLGLRN
jgi:hypothetical protein